MDSMMALPHEGHLSVGFQILSFLNSKHIVIAVLDPIELEIDLTQFLTEDWSTTQCVPCKEDAPSNAPTSRGTYFIMRDFVESYHACDSVVRLSRTSFIVFLNIAPIFVSSKK